MGRTLVNMASPASASQSGDVGPAKRMFSHYFKRYELLIEFKNLQNPKNCPLGLYIMPNVDDINTWHGAVFLTGTSYSDGVFKFTLKIPVDYPDVAPSLFLNSPLYHPLVDPATKQFDLSQQFRPWRPLKDYICHVLLYFKRSFSDAVLMTLQESLCPNKEALRLFQKDRQQFYVKAQSSCKEARALCENDAVGVNMTAPPKKDKDVNDALHKIFGEVTPIALKPVASFYPQPEVKKSTQYPNVFVSQQII